MLRTFLNVGEKEEIDATPEAIGVLLSIRLETDTDGFSSLVPPFVVRT